MSYAVRYFEDFYEVGRRIRTGTKKALNASLVGWLVLSFATLGFAPLELDSHDDFEVMYDWNEENNCIRYM